jgi:hypothetical protein
MKTNKSFMKRPLGNALMHDIHFLRLGVSAVELFGFYCFAFGWRDRHFEQMSKFI